MIGYTGIASGSIARVAMRSEPLASEEARLMKSHNGRLARWP